MRDDGSGLTRSWGDCQPPRWGRCTAALAVVTAAMTTAGCSDGGAGRVVISEIMYHPVLEEAADDHEFLELHNPEREVVDIGGWRLLIDRRESFTFPEGTVLGPGQYRVLARNREKLARLPAYALAADSLLGDYQGQLPNGGAELALVDRSGTRVEEVKYDDSWPWPVGADALGAGEAWLPEEQRPLAAHRGLGRSLERHSFTVSGRELVNWEASPLHGATPGRPNNVGGAPPVVVSALSATAAGGSALIGKDQPVTISATLSAGPVADLTVDYFVDDLARTDEALQVASLDRQGDRYVASIPALDAGSIVRYRVRGRRADGQPLQTLSPRPSDPFAWHAYFVNPPLPDTPTYQLFIAPVDWTTMYTNLQFGGGFVPNFMCDVNPRWNDRVPAVLVVDGKVYDVRVRYQGSRFQRWRGTEIRNWQHPAPDQPKPLRALSWSVSLPRYAPLGQRRQLTLKKNYQACPGVLNAATSDLFWAAGLPTDRFGFVRLHVNGGYYDYMIDIDPVSEEMLQRLEGDAPVGDLFKADGSSRDEGPWGMTNFAPLAPWCGYTAEQRYATSYERQTNEWKSGPNDPQVTELIQMIDGLAVARAAGLPAVRAHLERHFDVERLITQMAMRNFLGAWDDGYHNYQLYKRPADGKWIMLPQDLDFEMGGDPLGEWPTYAHPPFASFYVGEAGNRSNRLLQINALKDAVIKAYRPEFDEKLRGLAAGLLSPENVLAAIEEQDARWSRPDWNASPALKQCDVDARVRAARTWIAERHLVLRYRGIE
jgi:hypothetical protein